jgi:hypothetical protein
MENDGMADGQMGRGMTIGKKTTAYDRRLSRHYPCVAMESSMKSHNGMNGIKWAASWDSKLCGIERISGINHNHNIIE